MRHRYPLLLILAAAVSACSDEPGPTAPTPPVTPAPPALLREISIPSLPSPYYHFEYDEAGRVKALSFASGLRMYDVTYDGGRIGEMRQFYSTGFVQARLQYSYDDAGRVGAIRYVDSNGLVNTVLFFTYDGQLLIGIERDRRVEGGFVIDKTTSLSYYPDGNLRELVVHRPPLAGHQDETTTIDRFEQYDDKINVDGFDLIHDEFFDHVVLLPGVSLQKGNPARQTHTGDGVNLTVGYSYTYDSGNHPLTKTSDITILNGADAGRRFQATTVFSYY